MSTCSESLDDFVIIVFPASLQLVFIINETCSFFADPEDGNLQKISHVFKDGSRVHFLRTGAEFPQISFQLLFGLLLYQYDSSLPQVCMKVLDNLKKLCMFMLSKNEWFLLIFNFRES